MAAFEATGDATISTWPRASRRWSSSNLRGRERLARCRAFQRELELDPRLLQRRRVPALWHDARPLARVDAPAAAALGPRRRRLDWLPGAAKALFEKATSRRLEARKSGLSFFIPSTGPEAPLACGTASGGPAAEGSAQRHFLNAIDGAREYETWYRRIWDFVAAQLIDGDNGGWKTEATDPAGRIAPLFQGKPDLYHALQACLIPLLPTTGSIHARG